MACLSLGAAGVEHTKLLLALSVWGDGRHSPDLFGITPPPGLFREGVENLLTPSMDWDRPLPGMRNKIGRVVNYLKSQLTLSLDTWSLNS